jgi:hypothetical protein
VVPPLEAAATDAQLQPAAPDSAAGDGMGK